MNIPKNLKYTKDHEWIRIEDNYAFIGITDFAQGELGDIVYLEIETLGEFLNKEEMFGTVEAVKTVSDLYMPVSGEVIEINEEVIDNAELINKDPYNKGWLIKIKITDDAEINDLMSVEEYEKMIS